MSTPAIVYIGLQALSCGIVMSKHGQPSRYNFWASAVAASISNTLLHLGGFYA